MACNCAANTSKLRPGYAWAKDKAAVKAGRAATKAFLKHTDDDYGLDQTNGFILPSGEFLGVPEGFTHEHALEDAGYSLEEFQAVTGAIRVAGGAWYTASVLPTAPQLDALVDFHRTMDDGGSEGEGIMVDFPGRHARVPRGLSREAALQWFKAFFALAAGDAYDAARRGPRCSCGV